MQGRKLPQDSTLGVRLKAAREAAGLKKADLARKTGLSESYLGRLEKDRQEPSKVAIDAIARVVGVSSIWLATGQGEMKADSGATSPAPRSWQAALRPALAGGPLEDKLPWHEISVEDRDAAWRELAEDRKRDIMNVLRGMASVAEIVYRTLPRQHAERVLDCLADEMTAYLDAAF